MFHFFDAISSRSSTTINERIALTALSSSLADGSVVVEVGSLYGGSANIIVNAARDCRLHCIDINDFIDDAVVDRKRFNFFRGDSQSFSQSHKGLEIDMLFIDGDHSFYRTYLDYLYLTPMLKKDGIIIFHDVTPINMGVYVFVESLKKTGMIRDTLQIDTMCLARFSGGGTELSAGLFAETIEHLAMSYAPVQGDPQGIPTFGGSGGKEYYVGRGAFGYVASQFIGVDYDKFINSADAEDRSGLYFVFSSLYNEIERSLNLKNIPSTRIRPVSNLALSYYIYKDHAQNKAAGMKSLGTNPILSDILDKAFVEKSEWRIFDMYRSSFLGTFFRSFF